MLRPGELAPSFSLPLLEGGEWELAGTNQPTLLVFFETDCPTCLLTFPYLNKLTARLPDVAIIGISQDDEAATKTFVAQLQVPFPVVLDHNWKVSLQYDPIAVPTLFLLDRGGQIVQTQTAFDKADLNAITASLCEMTWQTPFVLAEPFDGNPATKPGCTSRHLEPQTEDAAADALNPYAQQGARASHIALSDDIDVEEYCLRFDPLPVIPPTVQRVARMLRATTLAPEEVIALVPPNYGQATVEKIAANAVMAGCAPEMMRVLMPLLRAVCDERYNIHGVQATTHFAAPLVIINGPIRQELGFVSGSNVFSNVARANSTLGRALQLILTNIGGARPGEMDMSTLGNAGKFSQVIAENEEENPWEPFHVEQGFAREQSALTLFAAEPPRGVSEHMARKGSSVLRAISRALATVWTYRMCAMFEAFVILCPEHVKTLQRDGFTKQSARDFLFANTGIPLHHYADGDGEGV
ncbi:MAG TPA: TlpA disulfide reductase family protein, partial [Blastocatellia bacterium]|nr:TlpA disulfide reductase family protein [Blastocatellia bacterium]